MGILAFFQWRSVGIFEFTTSTYFGNCADPLAIPRFTLAVSRDRKSVV